MSGFNEWCRVDRRACRVVKRRASWYNCEQLTLYMRTFQPNIATNNLTLNLHNAQSPAISVLSHPLLLHPNHPTHSPRFTSLIRLPTSEIAMPSSAPHRCTGSAGDECLPCQTCHCIVVHTKTLVPPYPPVPPETAAQSRKLLDVGFSSEVTNCAAKGMLHGVMNPLFDGDEVDVRDDLTGSCLYRGQPQHRHQHEQRHRQHTPRTIQPRSKPKPKPKTKHHQRPPRPSPPQQPPVKECYTSLRHDHNIRFELRISLTMVLRDWRVLCDEDALPMRVLRGFVRGVGGMVGRGG